MELENKENWIAGIFWNKFFSVSHLLFLFRSYLCGLCGAAFSKAFNLIRHEKVKGINLINASNTVWSMEVLYPYNLICFSKAKHNVGGQSGHKQTFDEKQQDEVNKI